MATVLDTQIPHYSNSNVAIDALLNVGPGWNYLSAPYAVNTLAYTFDISGIPSQGAGLTAFNPTQRAAVVSILADITKITGIKFAAVASNAQADIHFGAVDLASDVAGLCQTSWSYSAASLAVTSTLLSYSADSYVYLDNVEFLLDNGLPTQGGAGYEVLLHEIGHAMGLKHPFEGSVVLPEAVDNTNYTVMSYSQYENKSAFQAYDLLALQWIYGNDGLQGAYGLNSTNGPTLNAKYWGTNANDRMFGSNANDTLDGGAGSDLLYGGLGDDTYLVDTQGDLIFEGVAEGADTVIASTSFYLYDQIENLTLASGAGNLFGSANALDNNVTGNEGDNLLLGWDGNDTIVGNAGADILYGVECNDALSGGAGIDVLVGGNGLDNLDGGSDSDALYGEDGDDALYGGTGFATDILVGGAGNDTLDGSASIASGQTRNQGDYDLMDGGAGDDTYYVDTPADLTFEAAAGGTDTVIADINGGGYYLYANVENLTLTGNTPFGVGNELNNVMTGSILANWLLGGAGNDTLNGMGGNDVLFGEAGADSFVFERGTGGDVIGDYQAGLDHISLAGLGFTSFAQVQVNMVQNGGTTAIDLGQGDFVVLVGVPMTSLTAADFLLV
jgi:Ca2+-binding RTX toxin-like protein